MVWLENLLGFPILAKTLKNIRCKHYLSATGRKDNVGLLDNETLDEISELVDKTGHSFKNNEKLKVKVDTYVLETNVHFPTDLNLLWDAGRKSIELVSQIVTDTDIVTGWRKHHDWHKRLKSACLKAAKLTVGAGRNTTRGLNAALDYLSTANDLSLKIKSTKDILKEIAESNYKTNKFNDLLYFEEHLNTHIDLVQRRLIHRETIPHTEKLFSLFEPYTEWIKKGKAGNKVELGLRIAVATDQYGFILSHRVMEKEQDVDIAVPFAKELVDRYDVNSISFDKNFWSRQNYKELQKLVKNVVLPKKGKLNKEEYEREHSKQFKALRREHAAVESDINCLEHHGLNMCPDKGLTNFKRYTSFGVLAYNLHKLGNILLERDREQLSTRLPSCGQESPPLAKAA